MIRGCVVLTAEMIGLVFFLLSYTTGYYVFGEMKSYLILAGIIGALILETTALIFSQKFNRQILADICVLSVTVLCVFSMIMLLGDRVEGIGFTVVTQFDAGHGGAEACYLSFVSCAGLLLGGCVNVINSFLS